MQMLKLSPLFALLKRWYRSCYGIVYFRVWFGLFIISCCMLLFLLLHLQQLDQQKMSISCCCGCGWHYCWHDHCCCCCYYPSVDCVIRGLSVLISQQQFLKRNAVVTTATASNSMLFGSLISIWCGRMSDWPDPLALVVAAVAAAAAAVAWSREVLPHAPSSPRQSSASSATRKNSFVTSVVEQNTFLFSLMNLWIKVYF